MNDLHARKVPELDNLLGHAKGACDQRLRGNHGGHGCKKHQWNQKPLRRHRVKGIFYGLRVDQEQGTLAEIVQHETRHHHTKPGKPNWLDPKMPHIGIKRFAPGYAKNNRA